MLSETLTPAAEAEGAAPRPATLWNRNLLLLWQGQFVSNLGSQAFVIAVVFWIKAATGSATLVGLVFMLTGLAATVMGPLAGALADRYSRRNLIVLADLLSGAVVLAVAGLIMAVPHMTDLILGAIMCTAVALGVFGALLNPAIVAAIPDLAPEGKVGSANSVSQLGIELSTLIGQAVGGVLFQLLGAPLLFLLNGLSYLFSAASETFVRIPQRLPERPARLGAQLAELRRDLAAGLRHLWGARGLRGLVLLSSVGNFFNVPIIVLLPFFIDDVLGLSPEWYGYALAAYSAGTLVGYLGAGALALSGPARSRLALACMFLEALAYGLIALTSEPLLALAIAAAGGCLSGFLLVTVTTVVQIATPAELRGRIFGLLATIAGTLTPIAMGLAGVVADLAGQRIAAIYLACSAAMLLVALATALNPAIRGFLASEEAPAEGAPATS